MKAPVPTAKEINQAHKEAVSSAESAVENAIKCGQLLIAKKADSSHGEFEIWIKKHCDFACSTARRYMKAANQNATAVAFSSLSSLFPSGKKPKKKQKLTVQNATAVAFSSEPKPAKTAVLVDVPKHLGMEVSVSKAVSVIDLPKAAKEGPKAAPTKSVTDDDWEPERPDMEALEAEADQKYRERQDRVIESDDRLAAMAKELKSQQDEIALLVSQRDGFMAGKKEVLGLLAKEQRKVTQLEKKLKKAEEENERLRERVAIMEVA